LPMKMDAALLGVPPAGHGVQGRSARRCGSLALI
jgi:hypothetical protein